MQMETCDIMLNFFLLLIYCCHRMFIDILKCFCFSQSFHSLQNCIVYHKFSLYQSCPYQYKYCTDIFEQWFCFNGFLYTRPSVRVFRIFSSTCFEISIWNLIYTFSRWHDMSSLSCITIGSLWPSLQPKVGQTHFLQSWPHKSRSILQIWYAGGLLCTAWHKFRFL